MKRLLLLSLLLTTAAQAGITPPATHPGVWTLDSGNVTTVVQGTPPVTVSVGDIISAIKDPALARGDTIQIPAGNWTWLGQVRFDGAAKGFNINFRGGNGTLAQRPTITRGSFTDGALYITMTDVAPKATCRISNIQFGSTTSFAAPGFRLQIDGVGTITNTGGVFSGGIRIDHCRFAQNYYDNAAIQNVTCTSSADGLTVTCPGHHFVQGDVGARNPDRGGRYLYGAGVTSGTLGYYAMIIGISPGDDTTITLNTAITHSYSGLINFTGVASNDDGSSMYEFGGWVFGVLDHNEVDSNMLRYPMSKNGEVNHGGSPTGANHTGDYAATYLPPGRGDLAGWYDALVWEDNIFHRGTGAYSDSNTGGIQIARHNLFMGSMAVHGTKESGSARQHGGTLEEYYNNIYALLVRRIAPASSASKAIEGRDGEQIAYNNVCQMEQGGDLGLSYADIESPDTYGATSINDATGGPPVYWGSDGLNPLDNNAKAKSGNWTDPYNAAFVHHVDTAYSNGVGGVSNSTIYGGNDTVSGGVDTTTGAGAGLFSDVFGRISGGNLQPPAFSGQPINGVTITGTFTGLTTLPPNFFRGFVMRNAASPRSSQNPFAYRLIKTSTSAPVTGGTTAGPVDLVLTCFNCWGGSGTFTYPIGSVWELRKVQDYWSISSRGAKKVKYTDNNPPNPVTYVDTGTPHYVADNSGGCWSWDNVRRVGTGAYQVSNHGDRADPAKGEWGNIIKYFFVQGVPGTPTQVRPIVTPGYITPCVNQPGGVCSPIEPLFARGYRWDPGTNGGAAVKGNTGSDGKVGFGVDSAISTDDDVRPKTRIGPDWQHTFVDPQTFMNVFSNDPAVTGGGLNNNGWQEFATYYENGVGGDTLDYPHPLIAAPSPSPPAITSVNHATFTALQPSPGETFTVTATGNPIPSFTPKPTNWPTGVTFTDNSDGTATIQGIAIPTPAPAATPWVNTITARNLGGAGGAVATATQTFSLTILSPITVNLTGPANGSSYNTTPASLPMTATITGGTPPFTVNFYDDKISTSTPVGSDSTPDANGVYAFTYSTSVLGSHPLHAKVGSVDSTNTNTVSVVPPQASPTPAQIIVASRGQPPTPSATPTPTPSSLNLMTGGFGTAGNGTTDDQTAITTALAAAKSQGKALYCPGGHTYVHSAHILNDSVDVWGDGDSTIFMATSTTSVAFALHGTGAKLRNCKLDITPVPTVRSGVGDLIMLRANVQATNFVMDNVTVTHGFGAGIMASEGSSFGTINNCRVSDTLADGIHCTGGSHHITITNCTVTNPGDDMFPVVSYLGDTAGITHDITFQDNTGVWNKGLPNDSARGMACVGGNNVNFIHNSVTGTNAAGMIITSESSFNTFAASNVTATNNTITDACISGPTGHGGILVYGRSGFVTSNVLLDSNQVINSGNQGIDIREFVDGIKVTNCTIDTTGSSTVSSTVQPGIKVIGTGGGCNNLEVSNSTIKNTGSDGIKIGTTGTGYCKILTNDFSKINFNTGTSADVIDITSGLSSSVALTITNNTYHTNPSGWSVANFVNLNGFTGATVSGNNTVP